jgi:AraC-like DNA-binding protein/quercetin dioxygenase-like cupin family protein
MDELDIMMDRNDIVAMERISIRRTQVFSVPNFLATGGMREPRSSFYKHDHTFWEVVLYTRGQGTTSIGRAQVRFKPGTIICIPPNTAHSEVAKGGFQNRWVAIEELQADREVPVAHLSPDHPIFAIVSILQVESHLRKPNSELIMRNLFSTFMMYLNEWLTNDPHERIVSDIKSRLIANLENPRFAVSDALGGVPLSRDHARRLFAERVGETPVRYLAGLRMERAKELLQMGLGIKEVALRIGLPDQYYFSRLFSRTQGLSPSEYRKRRGRPVSTRQPTMPPLAT